MTLDIKFEARKLALEHGFDAFGVASPDLPVHVQQGLMGFLDQQHHGDMGWMKDKAERRKSPRDIWPDVQSVIVVAQNYAPAYDPMEKLKNTANGNISCYAQNEDYHDVIKKKLKQLARTIAERFGGDARVFVDTAPVMEKPLAERAGIGWQGKHTCLVSREFGSWLFLGEIFTTLPLAPDTQETDHCGSCRSCLDICPTKAFTAPRELDARRCISYLTIEHKGHIAREFRKAIGNRIYGCDDCLAICPWNKFAQTAREAAYHPRAALEKPLLAELAALDDAAFRAFFSKSPVKRIGRDRFVRNVLIAIGNSADPSLMASLEPLLYDSSALVRGAAIWAASQLATRDQYATLMNRHLPEETDTEVAAEWKGIVYG